MGAIVAIFTLCLLIIKFLCGLTPNQNVFCCVLATCVTALVVAFLIVFGVQKSARKTRLDFDVKASTDEAITAASQAKKKRPKNR